MIVRALLITFILLLLPDFSFGQEKEYEYWFPVEPFRIEVDTRDPEIRTLLQRWQRIGEEVERTSNVFAGTYRKDGYRGWILRWAPNEGFIYVFHSEGLSIIDFSYGRVVATPTGIQFIPERDMKKIFRQVRLRTPLRWVPIKSDHLRYMVPAEEMRDFGQYIGGFAEYNDFNGPCCEFSPFFESPLQALMTPIASSSIEVPPSYQHFIKAPIIGSIISVGRKWIAKDYGLEGKLYSSSLGRSSLTAIRLSIGAREGVRRNMLFRLVGESNLQYVKINRVGRRSSTAVVIRRVDEDGRETYVVNSFESNQVPYGPIRVGMKVTTSPILNE